MRVGTANFVSLQKAHWYYRPYGFTFADVERKAKDGEIAIGPPKCPENSYLTIDDDGRYVIVDKIAPQEVS